MLVLSHVRLFATLWTLAHQAPLSMGFSRLEYWSGLPFLTPGDLPNPGIETTSLASSALAGGFFTTEPLGQPKQLLECGKFKFCLLWNFLKFLPLNVFNPQLVESTGAKSGDAES